MVLWSAVVFILNNTCQTIWCGFLASICVFILLLSNFWFIVGGGINFFRLLLKRSKEIRHRRQLTKEIVFDQTNYVENPARDLDTHMKSISISNQSLELSKIPPSARGNSLRSNGDDLRESEQIPLPTRRYPPKPPDVPRQANAQEEEDKENQSPTRKCCTCCGYIPVLGVMWVASDMS